MNTQRRDYKEEIAMFIAVILFALFMLAWSFIADAARERKEQSIEPEVWEAFQNCINPYPSDYVCDSCWKAIIEPSFKHTNN